ncbi:kinase-like protein, partial [Obba rivulosa]
LNLMGKLCGRFKIIPKSFIIQAGAVQRTDDYPVALGGFADIWMGVYGSHDVALKVFRAYRAQRDGTLKEDMKTFCREAVIWRRLRHPNITPFHGIDDKFFPSQLALVCDWMPSGNIVEYLRMSPAANRLKLTLDMAKGLEYLHSVNIRYGDLKSMRTCPHLDNILVNKKQTAWLTDFGLATVYVTRMLSTTSAAAGSMRWMAPELMNPEVLDLAKAEVSLQSDVYALAMVIWEVFTGKLPFQEYKPDAKVMALVLCGTRPWRPVQATPLGLSDDLGSLIQTCWAGDRVYAQQWWT